MKKVKLFVARAVVIAASFGVVQTAFAAVSNWPTCSIYGDCPAQGPDGSQNETACLDCCDASCPGQTGGGSDCYTCCSAYNYGQPTQQPHCQLPASIPYQPN